MGIRKRLGIAVLAAVATFPAGAEAEHTRIALESTGPAGGNGALVADAAGSAVPGQRVIVTTAEPLTAGDTDAAVDLYARTSGSTTLLTAGAQGNGPFPANYGYGGGGGGPLVFQTDEPLTSADTDSALDVYIQDGSLATLVSTGPGAGANGAFDCFFAAASTDASRIFFTTRAQLTSGDTDASLDIYERSGGTTRLVSTGDAGGNGTQAVELAGINDTGTKAFFHTSEALTSADTDSVRDVYQRADGVTTLMSVGPGGANGPGGASYAGSSSDGSKVFFGTGSSLVAADTDDGDDIYERSGGTTVIRSIGGTGGNSGSHATAAGISDDGAKVFFQTIEKLVASDRDTNVDLYQSAGGAITLLSPGGNHLVATDALFVAASKNGDRVFFRSEEPLLANDTDSYEDIYESVNGALTRISLGPDGGNGPAHAFLGGISDDGTRAFFQTYESLDAGDTDSNVDIYERTAGSTYRVSTGNGALDADFRAVSADGMRVVFRTAESLLAGDTDGVADVYSANVPGTIRVVLESNPDDPQDVGFTAGGGLTPSSFQLDDDSDGALSNMRTFANLAPASGYSIAQSVPAGWSQASAACDDGSPVSDVDVAAGETVTCTFVLQRGYPRPRSATPVEVPLVPEYAPCTSPNRIHGPALEAGSCSPPLLQSSRLTTGSPDVNGRAASMEARAKFNVVAGNPATPADEGDVSIVLKATDVRLRTTLADYAGQLQGSITLRITDRLNGAGGDEIGTVTDVPLRVTVPCTVTADTTIGSGCYVSTTADAVLPGMVSESKRTIWQIGDVRVFDGGADGQAGTQDNTPFLRQGVFVP